MKIKDKKTGIIYDKTEVSEVSFIDGEPVKAIIKPKGQGNYKKVLLKDTFEIVS